MDFGDRYGEEKLLVRDGLLPENVEVVVVACGCFYFEGTLIGSLHGYADILGCLACEDDSKVGFEL